MILMIKRQLPINLVSKMQKFPWFDYLIDFIQDHPIDLQVVAFWHLKTVDAFWEHFIVL